jgi:hypothetical protein
MRQVVRSGAGLVWHGLRIPHVEIIELIYIIARIAFRKIAKGSSFNSSVLFFLRNQYRPHYQKDKKLEIEEVLCKNLNLIPAGDRIAYLSILGAMLGVRPIAKLLSYYMRNIWIDGYQWRMPAEIFDDELFDYRAWLISSSYDEASSVSDFLRHIIAPGYDIYLPLRGVSELKEASRLIVPKRYQRPQ